MADDGGDLKQAMFLVSDGVIGAAILAALGVYAGSWLDNKLHTSPWLLITLSILGGGVGLWRLVKKAMQIGQTSSAPSNNQPTVSQPPATNAESQSESGSSAGGMRQRNPFDDYSDEG